MQIVRSGRSNFMDKFAQAVDLRDLSTPEPHEAPMDFQAKPDDYVGMTSEAEQIADLAMQGLLSVNTLETIDNEAAVGELRRTLESIKGLALNLMKAEPIREII